MTETAFYILLSLTEPRQGYGIIQYVNKITDGRIKLGSGTVYGTLGKMEKSQIIFKKSHVITSPTNPFLIF